MASEGITVGPPARVSSPGLQKLILKFHLTMDESELVRRAAAHSNKKLVAMLAEDGTIDERLFLRFAASALCLRLVNVHDPSVRRPAESSELLAGLPQDFAMLHRCLPLRRENDQVFVALADPLDTDTISELQTLLSTRIEVCLAPEQEILSAIENSLNDDFPLEMNPSVCGADGRITHSDSDETLARAAPVISLVQTILTDAIRSGASDVHFEPTAHGFDVCFRNDGILSTRHTVPKETQKAVTSRIKLLSGMDITERRRPQDGRITLQVGKRSIDLRVSAVPTPEGEKLVLRVLSGNNVSTRLDQLTFPPETLALLQELLQSTDGVVLVTGPTGSGKTTTLYACITDVKQSNRHVITVEDPIERRLPGITQIQVDPKVNMTFASGLRSILRQDPDVILVGEIRDLETAETACHAAQTGHLVLSTLHTNDAPSAVTRLRDLGIESFSIASSLRGVLAQRLVRTLCTACARPLRPDEIRVLQKTHGIAYDGMKAPVGCAQCNAGYKGRAGLYSLLPIAGPVRSAIHEEASEKQIIELAKPLGYRTLAEAGQYLLQQGLTTVEEIERVLGSVTDAASEPQIRTIPGAAPIEGPLDLEFTLGGVDGEDTAIPFTFEPLTPDAAPLKIVNTSVRTGAPAASSPEAPPSAASLNASVRPEEADRPRAAARAPVEPPPLPAFHTAEAAEDSLLALARREAEREGGAKPKILLVDDDLHVRRVLSKAFRERSYDVEEASGVDEALASIDAAPPALIVCDLEMPHLDGRMLLSRLRAQTAYADIPVLMLMESPADEIEVELLEIGADDTVRKNSSLKLILSRVQRLLR